MTGWGLRNFTPLYKSAMGLWLGHPHNLFLMLLAETGLVGTVLLSGLVGWILAQAILLLKLNWHNDPRNNLILFTYLVAFISCIVFNCFDITILDGKINVIGWLLLSALSGIVYSFRNFRSIL